ncbi:MAG: GspE/PulE family protein [Pirellulales bacterium]
MSSTESAVNFQPAEWYDLDAEQGVAALIDLVTDQNVSDLFLACNERDTGVMIRHLGITRSLRTISSEQGRRFISHIKAMCGMNVAERRVPQDGRWVRRTGGKRSVDLRVSTIPTLYGEDMSLRILIRDSQLRSLDGLGFLRPQRNTLQDLLARPSGLILVTGPTGSGKTTTLYACLHSLMNGERKINTIEDPIEFQMDGVRQSQINLKIDVDFPELLRSVLRQAPDVIMIGEIRDVLTAETAVRAANSGHLVLATLHAPVAAGAVQSMLSLGVHPHFLATGLLGVVAQRLVRTLCPKCRIELDLSVAPHTFDDVRPWLEPGEGNLIYTSNGCDDCRQTRFAGRTGVFEVMTISRGLRELISNRARGSVIEQQAIQDGMLDFRRAALLKVAQGVTNVEEVLRTVPAEHLGAE